MIKKNNKEEVQPFLLPGYAGRENGKSGMCLFNYTPSGEK
jgi:hypothetical protein